MTFGKNLGILLLVLYFVFYGVKILLDPEPHAQFVYEGYINIYRFMQERGLHVQYTPQMFQGVVRQVVYAVGGLSVLGSLLSLLRYKTGPWILILLILIMSMTVLNPIFYSSDPSFQESLVKTVILHIGILAGCCGLLQQCGKKR